MIHNNFPQSFASGSRDGLMSKEDKEYLENLRTKVDQICCDIDEGKASAKTAEELANTALQVAQDKVSSIVFDTKAELDAWLKIEENVSGLKIGTTLLIRDKNTSDYWWDGETIQELETQKVNIDGYVAVGGDISDNTVDFTDDTELTEISSGSTVKILFGSVSKAIKSLISLIKTVGDTDISNSGGSITEAIDNISTSYLKKSGGEITSAETIPFYLKSTVGDTIAIGYKGTSGNLGFLGFDGVDNPIYRDSTGKSNYSLLHVGNYTKYTLPLTGGDLKGSLNISASAENLLKLFRTETTEADARIQFGNAAGAYGSIGMKDTSGLYRMDNSGKYYKVLDEETAGEIQLPAVGKDGYIMYPDGGTFIAVGNQTGYLNITIPQAETSTMFSFKVSIFDYDDGSTCDYHISGQVSSVSAAWAVNALNAYSVSKYSTKSKINNLPVNFGKDGESYVIQIGNSDTEWGYPQVRISEVLVGYKDYEYEKWASGWDISFTVTAAASIDATISNPANWYYSYLAERDADGNDISSTYLKKSGGTMTGTLTSQSITPEIDNNYTLGTSDLGYSGIFGTLHGMYSGGKAYGMLNIMQLGTTSQVGIGRLLLGNAIASGTADNAKGQIIMYGTNTGYTTIESANDSASSYTIKLPANSGTLALTSDIANVSIGGDGYIPFPEGGLLITKSASYTGLLKIRLPVSWTNTMIKFKVSIYNFENDTSLDYIIAGYNYATTPAWSSTAAYCISRTGNSLSNLPVSFGHDGTYCAITIGTTDTVWKYPQIMISEVVLGFSGNSFDTWKSDWGLSIIQTELPTITRTITNTGRFIANSTAVADLSTAQVRNISIGTTALTAGTSTLAAGTIYFQYASS